MDFDKAKNMVEEYFNGQYELIRLLGEGAFAEVYLVKHNFLNHKRAMKIIKEPIVESSNIEDIFQEVRLASKLRHENIISIYDAGLIEEYDENSLDNYPKKEWAYFIMEYISGGDLEDYRNSFIHSNKRMPIHSVLTIIKQILLGLNTLHKSNPAILHRDLKTNNILLNYDSEGKIIVKISDFGFSREVNSKDVNFELGGTRPYMAPECFKKSFSTESDVYAVGVIFYLLLCGDFPYKIDEFCLDDIISGKPWKNPIESIDEVVPEYIQKIVLKAINIPPKERYENAKCFLYDLNLAIDEFKQSSIYLESLNEDDFESQKEDILEFNESDFKDYKVNDQIRDAFNLAKCENGLDDAISILEKEILKDYEIRKYYAPILKLWKAEYPDAKLISEAFSVCLKGENYKLAINLLREAFAYNPDIENVYGHYIDLWAIFVKLEKSRNLKEAIDSLDDLMNEKESINHIYADSISILKSYSPEKILEEALILADGGNLIEASNLLEFLVVYDDKIRENYSYKLSLYKQDLDM